MPGDSPYEAVQAFIDPLKRALSAVAVAKIQLSPGAHRLNVVHAWTVNRGEGTGLRGGLTLKASMNFEVVPSDPQRHEGRWRVTTRGYWYSLLDPAGGELLLWHWHPAGHSHFGGPHLHVGAALAQDGAAVTPKTHIGTDRVSFEQVVRTAVEAGAQPLHEDWQDRLTMSEAPFVLYRSWSHSPEEAMTSSAQAVEEDDGP